MTLTAVFLFPSSAENGLSKGINSDYLILLYRHVRQRLYEESKVPPYKI